MSLKGIGKLCLLLVVFGFFMPVACDQNAFQIVDNGMLKTEGVVAIYVLFIFAIIGIIIGILLLLKINIPAPVDWIVTLVCLLIAVIMFCYIGFGQESIDYFQTGAYFILIGPILTFIFQIASAGKSTIRNIPPINAVDINITGILGVDYIVIATVAIRNGPDQNFENIGILRPDETVKFYKNEKEFSYIEAKNGIKGWCLTSCIQKI
ncbi:hypothetical protein FACS1894151_01660 [Spirochaetia bacterium]|nr:hypothetical protein FACS1894151_01660 [Spirochaetia bacterium]